MQNHVVAEAHCPVCSLAEASHTITAGGFEHRSCSFCGTVFVLGVIEKSALRDLYQRETGYSIPLDHAPIGGSVWGRVASKLKSNNVVRVLDVGCGSGSFLKDLPSSIEKYGCDLNAGDVEEARLSGLSNVAVGRIEDQSYASDFFDYVHLGDVIEHVQNPNEILAEVERVMKSNGYLTISTPDMASFWARGTFFYYKLFRIPPSVLTPPHHLTNLSRPSLKLLLENHGFVVREEWSDLNDLKYDLAQLGVSVRDSQLPLPKKIKSLVLSLLYGLLWAVEVIRYFFSGRRFGKEARVLAQKKS